MFCFLFFIALANAQFTATTKCNSAFCKTCDDSGATCSKCQDEFFLDGNNCVHKSEKHCKKVSYFEQKDGTYKYFCAECEEDYEFDFDKLTCVEGEEWCAYIKYIEDKEAIKCTQGKPGYALYNNELIDCSSENEYCTQFDTSIKYADKHDICHHCLTCEGLRMVADGYCEDFEAYIGKGENEREYRCQSGYYKATTIKYNEETYPVCVEGNVKDCLTYAEDDTLGNKCTKCINDEWFDGESCKSCKISHCEVCHFRRGDVCIQCEEDYYIGGDGQCYELPENCAEAEPNGKCTKCEEGYLLNTETTKCQKCAVANCDECEFEVNGETKTEKCTSCETGYAVNEEGTQCVKCPAGCRSCSAERCTSCENDDLTPAVTKCVARIEECTSYKDDGTCEQCNYGQDPKNGKCVENGCLVFDSNANKCQRCADGYYFTSDFKCQKCNEICGDHTNGCIYKADICYGRVYGCIEYDEKNQCLDCGNGYEMDGDYCVEGSYYFKCVEYLHDRESCGLCEEYFYELDEDDERIGSSKITNQYWPDRWGTCGAGSSFILMSILLLALIAFF